MIDLVRLTTVHPALVHFALGPLPIVVAAYALGAVKRSERWTFVGDVAVASSAAMATAALAFGVVSNAVLAWPGGFDTWRWLHVGFGIGSTCAIVVLAVVRTVARRRARVAGAPTLVASAIATALMLLTGWIGGEVLVFRSGMAVRAAADGALAPASEPAATPADLGDAMGRLRGAWADTTTRLAQMVVHHPREDDYERIRDQAERMETLARWIEVSGGPTLRDPTVRLEHGSHGGGFPETRADHLSEMARMLRERAQNLVTAARRSDLQAAVVANASIEAQCVDCHAELR